jgi:hypothetical protein
MSLAVFPAREHARRRRDSMLERVTVMTAAPTIIVVSTEFFFFFFFFWRSTPHQILFRRNGWPGWALPLPPFRTLSTNPTSFLLRAVRSHTNSLLSRAPFSSFIPGRVKKRNLTESGVLALRCGVPTVPTWPLSLFLYPILFPPPPPFLAWFDRLLIPPYLFIVLPDVLCLL